ncbi:MAG: hypothetical protein DRJ50_15780, partial [Actinobacteria bacterium]
MDRRETPLFQQIFVKLKEGIGQGVYPEGSLPPSERVRRTSARRAAPAVGRCGGRSIIAVRLRGVVGRGDRVVQEGAEDRLAMLDKTPGQRPRLGRLALVGTRL